MTEEEKHEARKQRLEQKSAVTMRLSETTRFVAFGIIAWVFAVQSSDAEFSKSYISEYEIWVNAAGVLAIFSIASDYFQYLSAYVSVKHALTRKGEGYQYNKNHPAYLLQLTFFIIKQIAVGLGAVIVALTFTIHVVQH
ncbi:hypothetical protein [Oceaniglobus roseus]|uniref:hypothetical protein n=1 Tax=Oceaniglobus roseus TaxID=1737570 RepID=UPI0012FFD578|nr:hypothetical protein [Kandeliimicrobium roseum]